MLAYPPPPPPLPKRDAPTSLEDQAASFAVSCMGSSCVLTRRRIMRGWTFLFLVFLTLHTHFTRMANVSKRESVIQKPQRGLMMHIWPWKQGRGASPRSNKLPPMSDMKPTDLSMAASEANASSSSGIFIVAGHSLAEDGLHIAS